MFQLSNLRKYLLTYFLKYPSNYLLNCILEYHSKYLMNCTPKCTSKYIAIVQFTAEAKGHVQQIVENRKTRQYSQTHGKTKLQFLIHAKHHSQPPYQVFGLVL